MKFLYISLSALLLLTMPTSAQAQDFIGSKFGEDPSFSGQNAQGGGFVNQYSKKYQKGQNPIIVQQGLIPPSQYNILFVREARTEDNQDTDYFNTPVLRVTSKAVINGCVKIVQPSADIRTNGRIMYIDIQDAVITPDKSVQYAHFECNQGNHMPKLDIPLDTQMMRDEDVSTLSIKVGHFTDYFDVSLDEDALILSPRSRNAFTPFHYPHIINPLDFPFYPEDVVVLTAPQASPGEKLAKSIAKLASDEGLEPLADTFPLNIKPEHTRQFYFRTKNADVDIHDGQQIEFGHITVPETLYGPDGAYAVGKKLAVYARLPHELD